MDLSEKKIAEYENWFSDYLSRFKQSLDLYFQKNIQMKEMHSQRVRKEIKALAQELALPSQKILCAELIGLFHDIGRFIQFKIYGTFKDSRSEDHAKLGVKIIQQEKLFMEFQPELQEVIIKSIRYHNRADLPPIQDENIRFFSRLLRDADKLDIFKVVTDYYAQSDKNDAIELELPDTAGISAAVFTDIMQERIVKSENLSNFNDFKVLQMAWIFDINFLPTFQRIAERKFLEKIKAALPNSEKVNKIYQKCNFFLKEKIVK